MKDPYPEERAQKYKDSGTPLPTFWFKLNGPYIDAVQIGQDQFKMLIGFTEVVSLPTQRRPKKAPPGPL